MVYVGAAGGFCYAISPTGAVNWKFDANGNMSGSSPAVGPDGTVYICSADGFLYAVNGSSKGLAGSSWPMFHRDLTHTGKYTAASAGGRGGSRGIATNTGGVFDAGK